MSQPGEPVQSRQAAARFFVPTEGPQSRRPVDALIIVLGLLLTAVSARMAEGRSSLDAKLLDLPTSLPDGVTALFDATYLLGSVYAVGVAAVVLVTAPHRGRLPIAVAAAAGLALAGTILGSAFAGEGWPDFSPDHAAALGGDTFPTVRVAVVAAVLLVVRPWIVSTYRRFNAAVAALLCVAAWAIGVAGPPDVLGALGVGLTAAGVVLVLLGSPGGHPTIAQVAAHLSGLGVEVGGLRFAEPQPWGVRVLYGTAVDGAPLLVKVYGRDATDAHRAARWWRALLYRDQRTPDATRLQLVEHEALVTILAERAGVRVSRIVAAAAMHGDAVLVLDQPPSPPVDHVDDELLKAMWQDVARLRAAGLCHAELTLDKFSRALDGVLVLSDFKNGSLSASPSQLAADVATLLTAQAAQVGAVRAVEAALAVLGAEDLVAAQPYLQGAVMPRSMRGRSGVKQLLTELRQTIADRTGSEAPPPAPVQRLNWRDLIQTLILVVAAYALLTMLMQLDWDAVFDTWANATWAWVALGIVVAQGTSVADSVSTMSAVTQRLPLLPLVYLQYAIKLVGLAISATAGRIALNTSFLKRFGEGPAVAVTASALDSFAGAAVNVVVVLLAVLVAGQSPDVPMDGPDDLGRLIVLLVVCVVIAVGAVALLPALRRRSVAVVRSGWAALSVVTRSPARGFALFGSNLASLLITAVAMACMVAGLYPSLDYGTVLAVTAAAALFSAIIPVPGNVGVAEAAISAGLVIAGVPSGPAFAIAVTQRIATSYLPPLFGVWSLRWLRREDYVG